MAEQKSREDWVWAASRALRRGGVDGVRVEALARELGVTKGSFYWHFRDRAELLESLLSLWEAETTVLIERAERESTPSSRLMAFFRGAAAMPEYPPDLEIFAWARRDSGVAARVTATEERRMAFIAGQLEAAGVAAAEARRRAEVGYLATVGWLERRAAPWPRPGDGGAGGDEEVSEAGGAAGSVGFPGGFEAFAGEVFPLLAEVEWDRREDRANRHARGAG